MVVKSRHYPTELVATRRGSPLLVGVKCEGLTTDHIPVEFSSKALATSLPSSPVPGQQPQRLERQENNSLRMVAKRDLGLFELR